MLAQQVEGAMFLKCSDLLVRVYNICESSPSARLAWVFVCQEGGELAPEGLVQLADLSKCFHFV